jgi:hypothetical protein
MPRFPVCPRCGAPLDYVTVRTVGGDVWYWPSEECGCPIPRCPFCHHRLDQSTPTTHPGECPNPDCFLWTHLIPNPEMD